MLAFVTAVWKIYVPQPEKLTGLNFSIVKHGLHSEIRHWRQCGLMRFVVGFGLAVGLRFDVLQAHYCFGVIGTVRPDDFSEPFQF